MEMHGSDIFIRSNSSTAFEDAIDEVRLVWKDSVLETESSDRLREAFIYTSPGDKDAWDQLGWTVENDNKLIHILKNAEGEWKDGITVVVGDDSSILAEITNRIAVRISGTVEAL
jgi:hypothetical protein